MDTHKPGCVIDSNDNEEAKLLCNKINENAYYLNKLIPNVSYLTKIESAFKENDIQLQTSMIEIQNTLLDELKKNFPQLFNEIKICKMEVNEQNKYENLHQNLLDNYINIYLKLDNEYKSMIENICVLRKYQNINKSE